MQILYALINNAIKFTYKGFVIISFQVDIQTSLLGIKVEDSGIGMSERQID
jgi:signal transduction histidine kinase